MIMYKKKIAVSVGIVALALGNVALADYPERPIELIVPWSAGGGTDAVSRQLAEGLKEELGQPVNVVNRTGGGGIVGHTLIGSAQPDGYTIGMITGELGTYENMGLADVSHEDVTPVALINFDPASFTVSADSAWEDLDDALGDIQANAGTYTASGTGPGAPYHLAFSGFLDQQGIDPASVTLVPSEGAAPALQEVAGGGIDIVYSSLPETEAMRSSGRVRTLAVFADERIEAFPDVPTAKEVTGDSWSGGTWRGIAGPEGLPEDVVQTLAEATQSVYDSEEFKAFMANTGFGTVWRGPEAFGEFLIETDATNAPLINKLGLAQ
ncbi:Bug family tripartite tricarboxylate transporter substrate binding protein [Halomonas nitroreducens]|uniref:Tripartite tricarboxylate transporter substrate binding protein n=1 Tax=Halomonas nitroreducens TaxID=447425 RepID=A0A431UZL1_9GAMM|nr:tripartite tricarboxylate transporter substrate binding protein [Halomonas nitroreducens]RTQ99594.1 tripartite tricarboxylate transporter substrate binding protein [Halomonas nitroreducens]